MITIGQLARYAGVSVKTVRVYHAKGLLAEPERDASNYRRYTAGHAIDLIKIRTLVEAGVPLARIRELRAGTDEQFRAALRQIDAGIDERVGALRQIQDRLRRLAEDRLSAMPAVVDEHLAQLRGWGFTERWVALQADLWILVFAAHPEAAATLVRDQAEMMADPALRRIYRDYDRAYDLDPADECIEDLARRMARATRDRYGDAELPGQDPRSEVPTLIQQEVNAASPAWQRIDTLLRRQLGRP